MNNQKEKYNPWLGLKTYEEGQTLYGRTDDINILSQSILFNIQTVIYGKSGIGKSSILKAGIFPILRLKNFFPVYIRLDHNQPERNYNSQIWECVIDSLSHLQKENITPQGTKETIKDLKGKVVELIPNSRKKSLWEMFHGNKFYNTEGKSIQPVLVFDQFEEIFTREQDQNKVLTFFSELADLINNVEPQVLYSNSNNSNNNTEKLTDIKKNSISHDILLDDEYTAVSKNYLKESNFRLVLSLREDCLFYLERNIANIPPLRHNRHCLKPLNVEQATSVITEPMPTLVPKDVATEIIRKVTGELSKNDNSTHIEINSAILSLYLSELYKRKPIQSKTIDLSIVSNSGDNIIQDFYEKTMSSVSDKELVAILEDKLITPDGKRDNAFVKDIVRSKKNPKEEDRNKVKELNRLKEQRLIHEFPWNNEGLRIEFMHDVLCETIIRRKEKRLSTEANKRKIRNITILLGLTFLFLTIFVLIRTNITERNYSESLQEQMAIIQSLNQSLQEQMAITQEKNDSLQILTKLNYEQMLKTQSLNHSLQEQMGITQRKNDSLHALMILNEEQMIITKLLNESLHEQMTITQRKNDSLLTLVRLNEEKKTFIQTNINEVRLNFAVGKASIVEDSTTLAELKKLAEQVKSFEGEMLSIVIEHSASPEGNLLSNKDLARRRAEVVKEFLYPYSGDIPTSVSVTMHTWFDVANLLYNEGFVEESKAVAQAIANSEGSIEPQIFIRRLPFYSSIIKATILPQLQTTTCKLILK